MKKTYEVEIMGQKFNIKSDEEKAHVDRIVDYISDKMRKISKSQKTASLHDLAILTLLNVSDELFKNKTETGEYKERLAQKVKNIIRLIDAQPESFNS